MASLFKPTKPVPLPPTAEIISLHGRPHARIGSGKKSPLYPLASDGTKYLKPSKKWYGKFRDGNGVVKKVPLSADKNAAQQMLAELVRKSERVRVGLHDPAEDHARRPLAEHLGDYAGVLEAKGDTADHVRQTIGKVRAIFDGCQFAFLKEVDVARATDWLNSLRRGGSSISLPDDQEWFTPAEVANLLGISGTAIRAAVNRLHLPATGHGKARRFPRATVQSLVDHAEKGVGPQTVNHYIRAVRGFFRWLVKSKRIATNPLETLSLLNVEIDIRRARRELTADELRRLLSATRLSNRTYRGLTGEDRFHLYLTAATTGFRASALSHLTPADFDLQSSPPTVTLAARFNKSKKQKVQPLPAETVAALVDYLPGKPVDAPLWGSGTWARDKRGAEMLRGDLSAAGIPYRTSGSDGFEYADFHSLRHTFLTLGGLAGIDLRTLQELAGHSKPELTARYSHRRLTDLAGAVAKLPNLTNAMVSEVGKGTPDVPGDVPPARIDPHRVAPNRPVSEEMDECRTVGKPQEMQCLMANDGPKGNLNQARATGLEPATTGSTVRYSNQLSYAPGTETFYNGHLRTWEGTFRTFPLFRLSRPGLSHVATGKPRTAGPPKPPRPQILTCAPQVAIYNHLSGPVASQAAYRFEFRSSRREPPWLRCTPSKKPPSDSAFRPKISNGGPAKSGNLSAHSEMGPPSGIGLRTSTNLPEASEKRAIPNFGWIRVARHLPMFPSRL